MAAAARHAIMRPAHAILGSNLTGHHGDRHRNDAEPPKTNDGPKQEEMGAEESKERESVAQSSAEVLPPQKIAQDPEKKDMGQSSSVLRIQDFELVKTLGTGTAHSLV